MNGPSAPPATPILQEPSNGSKASGVTLLFLWESAYGAAEYQYQLAMDTSFTNPIDFTIDGRYLGIALTGFPDNGSQFWWRVKTRNSLGESAWSPVWNFINGPSDRGEIHGTVTNGTTPITGALLTIGFVSALTDVNGYYSLPDVPAGTHDLRASQSGFSTQTQTITRKEGETVTVNFTLTSNGNVPNIQVNTTLLALQSNSQSAGLTSNLSTFSMPETLRVQEPVASDQKDILPGQYVIGFQQEPSDTLLQELGVSQQHLQTFATRKMAKGDIQASLNRHGTKKILKSRVKQQTPSNSSQGKQPGLRGKDYRPSVPYIVVEVEQAKENTFLNDIKKLQGVKFVVPRRYAYASGITNDTYSYLQHSIQQTQLPAAWERGNGSGLPLVAVIDTGIDYTHPDLAGQFGALKGYDFVDDDSDPMPDFTWEEHGTHVAGIIAAAKDNTLGIAGPSSAQLLSVRVLSETGSGTYDDVVDGVDWAVSQGAKIINMSLGGGYDPFLETAVKNAWNNGVLVIAASGNSGSSTLQYPAGFPEVISVGALQTNGTLAAFSNYGAKQELVAPGTMILSTYPGSRYVVLQGTSMAAPEVTGIAALMLSHKPQLTNVEVRALLANTADDLGTSGRDDTYGYGRVNAFKALNTILTPIATQSFLVQNTGEKMLEVTQIQHSSTWLHVSPVPFNVWPGGTQEVLVWVDAANLASGTYQDTLILHSNDPDQPTLTVYINFIKTLRVIEMIPIPGSSLSTILPAITVTFDSAVNESMLNSSTFTLTRSGGDGIFGNGNDIPIPGNSINMLSPTQAKFDLTGITLPDDTYQVTLVGGIDGQSVSSLKDATYLTLAVSGQLKPPSDLVTQIERDLNTIRRAFPEMSLIPYTLAWFPGELSVELTPEAKTQYDNGTYHGLDNLNAQYGPVTMMKSPVFWETNPLLMLRFNYQYYNMPLLVGIYSKASGVKSASLNAIGGGRRTTIEKTTEGLYKFSYGWGDCQAGCINRHYWTFRVNNGVATLEGEEGSPVTLFPSSVRDIAGNPLDGEFSGTFASGNGTVGGNFVTTFAITGSAASMY